MLTQRATSSLTLSLLFTFLMLTLTDTMKKTGKTVRFSNDITNIPEPKYLAEDLHLMRMSDFNMRRADRERMVVSDSRGSDLSLRLQVTAMS